MYFAGVCGPRIETMYQSQVKHAIAASASGIRRAGGGKQSGSVCSATGASGQGHHESHTVPSQAGARYAHSWTLLALSHRTMRAANGQTDLDVQRLQRRAERCVQVVNWLLAGRLMTIDCSVHGQQEELTLVTTRGCRHVMPGVWDPVGGYHTRMSGR